ncbi:hypothetical protein N9R81_05915 [Flavobacteriales bacterium]|nr:hypothetical protein [Flavobacteriales bacterium]
MPNLKYYINLLSSLIFGKQFLWIGTITSVFTVTLTVGIIYFVNQHKTTLEYELRLKSKFVLKLLDKESYIDVLMEDGARLEDRFSNR